MVSQRSGVRLITSYLVATVADVRMAINVRGALLPVIDIRS